MAIRPRNIVRRPIAVLDSHAADWLAPLRAGCTQRTISAI